MPRRRVSIPYHILVSSTDLEIVSCFNDLDFVMCLIGLYVYVYVCMCVYVCVHVCIYVCIPGILT